MSYRFLLVVAVCGILSGTSSAITCNEAGIRRDCGYVGIQQPECNSKGCCWHPTQDHSPWCFHPNPSPASYTVKNILKTFTGLQLVLETKNSSGVFGPPITPLNVLIDMETSDRLHVKIYDPATSRWEIPTQFVPSPKPPVKAPSTTQYAVSTASIGKPFWFSVVRSSNNETIFNSSASSGSFDPLIFEDQFLELSTTLPSDANIYGLGEHVGPLKLNRGQTYTMWNFDTATPPNLNLYGSHPFYLDLRTSSMAHGVFLRNSNGMDVTVNNGSLTYGVIGGVFDLYFFLGPEPEAVIQQYEEVIGRPHMPPYWALGFHQSRYGFKNVAALQEVVTKYAQNQIPLDTMWNDIDYMDQYKDFTLDPNNFPKDQLDQFVGQLHKNGQHYVVIVDPGIKSENGYKSYVDGVRAGIFIKDRNNNIFIGKVWPGNTAFPDFFNPGSFKYWQDQIATLLELVPVDGLWVDMNEISNFCNGECSGIDDYTVISQKESSNVRQRRTLGFDPTDPPYGINNQGSHAPLNAKTLDADAQHYGGVLEYNCHNLFGLTEAMATDFALTNLTQKRSFVLSRSTFPGSGRHTAHWTGDNHASFDDLYYSIPGMLNFQMFGIPLVGSDICGFIGTTTEELCGRWMQLGAFYPFSRNHDDIHSPDQEPYLWPSVAAISRDILRVRYSLLPYYYTLFFLAHRPVVVGQKPAATVTRPLFFEFPNDAKTYDIDKQFLVGNGLLVSPVLEQGSTSVEAYFPQGKWYDFFTNATVSESGGETKQLQTPADRIQVHVRGGVTIPMQEPGMTTAASRLNPFKLLVALDSQGISNGSLYFDDGISLDMSKFTMIYYATETKSGQTVLSARSEGNFLTESSPPLNSVIFLGLSKQPSHVSANGKEISSSQMTFDSTTNTLSLIQLRLSMSGEINIVIA
eukprot:m.2900 g.2900  ORF g.2900 m.2900 type:complete len:913 (+) comp8961_c0_seq1:1487-4225(+)